MKSAKLLLTVVVLLASLASAQDRAQVSCTPDVPAKICKSASVGFDVFAVFRGIEFVIADKEAFNQQKILLSQQILLSQRTAPTSLDDMIVVLADNGHTVKKVVVSTERFREPVGANATDAKVEVKYGSYDPQQMDKWITYIAGYLDGWQKGRLQGWQSGYSEARKTASK